MKQCSRCLEHKPLDSFSQGPRYRDGLQAWCKNCMRAYRAEKKANPDAPKQPRRPILNPVSHYVTADTKRCTKCGEIKHTSEYAPNNRARDGLAFHCRPCHTSYHHAKVSTPEGQEAERTRAREFYRNNEQSRRRNLDQTATRHRLKMQTDPAYYRRYRDHQNELNRTRRREYRNNYSRERHRTNEHYRLQRRIAYHRRRDRITAAGEHFTPQEWLELCARYDHRCLCCGEQKPLQPDHVVPISKGGPNAITNIQPLCASCNYRKNAKTIDYRPLWESQK